MCEAECLESIKERAGERTSLNRPNQRKPGEKKPEMNFAESETKEVSEGTANTKREPGRGHCESLNPKPRRDASS